MVIPSAKNESGAGLQLDQLCHFQTHLTPYTHTHTHMHRTHTYTCTATHSYTQSYTHTHTHTLISHPSFNRGQHHSGTISPIIQCRIRKYPIEGVDPRTGLENDQDDGDIFNDAIPNRV